MSDDGVPSFWLKRQFEDRQPALRTSKPYPQLLRDAVAIASFQPVSGILDQVIIEPTYVKLGMPEESVSVAAPQVISGVLREYLRKITAETEQLMVASPQVVSGILRTYLRAQVSEPELIGVSAPQVLSGVLREYLVVYTAPPDDLIGITATVTGGSLG